MSFFSVAEFLRTESSSGFVLIAAALAGLIWANSPFQQSYHDLLHLKMTLAFGRTSLALTLHEWINDALMAGFFLLVGLELKRELLRGALSSTRRAALPAIAALGGVIVPSLICAAFVAGDPSRLRGWAIPAATDIAFALAALRLLGHAVPTTMTIFLTALAIIDDLAAILIIAIFYTVQLEWKSLAIALACLLLLVIFNRLRLHMLAPYLLVGIVMWFFVLDSGVHATLAGVALALTIPLESRALRTPLETLEHALHPYVSYVIVPIFGLANAGVTFAGLAPSIVFSPLPLGIAVGLFAGKQLGVLSFSWIAIKARIATMPDGGSFTMLWGVGILAGIGFTMSLFVGTLAFTSEALLTETKIGVLAGSLLSALVGYFVLRSALEKRRMAQAPSD